MPTIVFWILIFILSLFILIKASDYFTESAEQIGKYFGIPAFIIGVTIVAIGTSLPELISSIIAVTNNASEIVISNVIGSNIANIFLILGISAVVAKKMKISYELIHVDLPLLIASAFLLAAIILDGNVSKLEAIICLAGLVVYILYTISTQEKDHDEVIDKKITHKSSKRKLEPKTIPVLVLSAFFIYIGAKYTIQSVIELSEILNIAKQVIAISAVALGTSLPELAVSLSAAKKGKAEIAVGNILGSNIFNAYAVVGIPALINNLSIPQEIITFGLPIMLIATLLYYFITQDKQITQWEGWILIIFYIFFIGKIFSFI